ncbi:MAG: hypothetical protein ABIA21_00650 [Candidatus Aenigmatarchaeota archaeon]
MRTSMCKDPVHSEAVLETLLELIELRKENQPAQVLIKKYGVTKVSVSRRLGELLKLKFIKRTGKKPYVYDINWDVLTTFMASAIKKELTTNPQYGIDTIKKDETFSSFIKKIFEGMAKTQRYERKHYSLQNLTFNIVAVEFWRDVLTQWQYSWKNKSKGKLSPSLEKYLKKMFKLLDGIEPKCNILHQTRIISFADDGLRLWLEQQKMIQSYSK